MNLFDMTRRQHLALLGGATLAALGRPALAQGAVIRQGYQTNIWGMPTYYLLQSGALQKQGIKFEEFAVPSGNLTMQQMVARQVDLGTYAGQSFILGADRGDLVAIAQIEQVGLPALECLLHPLRRRRWGRIPFAVRCCSAEARRVRRCFAEPESVVG